MEILTNIFDALVDALKDCAIIVPFMFAAFIVIGLIERGTARRMVSLILTADKVGPAIGGLLGAVPSCGFSAAASNLFGAELLTTGTLISVYISTSDEMLAVMISERADVLLILKILAIKIVSGIAIGFLIDGAARLFYLFIERKNKSENDTEDTEETSDSTDEYIDGACACGCSDGCCAASGGLFTSAIKRTVRIVLFILAVSFLINVIFTYIDKNAVATFISKFPVLGCVIASFIGLIPNCAVSVALTEFYLDGIISASTMLCGLMTGAGSGLLVLFGTNRSKSENFTVAALLVVSGLLFGSLSGALFF